MTPTPLDLIDEAVFSLQMPTALAAMPQGFELRHCSVMVRAAAWNLWAVAPSRNIAADMELGARVAEAMLRCGRVNRLPGLAGSVIAVIIGRTLRLRVPLGYMTGGVPEMGAAAVLGGSAVSRIEGGHIE